MAMVLAVRLSFSCEDGTLRILKARKGDLTVEIMVLAAPIPFLQHSFTTVSIPILGGCWKL